MEKSETREVHLKVEHVDLSFGGVKALDDINLDVRRGELLAVIGPNGAGKTCLINCITGFYRPQEGHIYFDDQDITGWPPYRIAKLRLARTFQNIGLCGQEKHPQRLRDEAYTLFSIAKDARLISISGSESMPSILRFKPESSSFPS